MPMPTTTPTMPTPTTTITYKRVTGNGTAYSCAKKVGFSRNTIDVLFHVVAIIYIALIWWHIQIPRRKN